MTAGLLDLSPDLLALICIYISNPRFLAKLARTCRTLSEVALQQVWHTIPSFSVFAYTLPRELWVKELKPMSYLGYTLSFNRPIYPTDLSRFRKYALYVKAVSGLRHWPISFTITPSAWRKLESILRPDCLPNLRSISKHDGASDAVEPMHAFLGKSLHTLEYSFICGSAGPVPDPAARWITKLLVALPNYANSILTFRVKIGRAFWNVLADEMLGKVTGAMPRLVSFVGPSDHGISPSALCNLAAIPTLRILEVTLGCEAYPNGVSLSPTPSFPSLQTVKVRADSCLLCLELLKQVCSRHLEKLDLDVDTPVSMDDFRALATTVADCPSAPAITSLIWRLGPSILVRREPEPVLPEFFAILHGLRNLQNIDLRRGCYAALDDDSLAAMVEAWPRIQDAVLGNALDYGPSGVPRVTLSGLAAVARRSQSIRRLVVPLANISRLEVERLLTRKPPKIFEPVVDYMCEGLGLFRTACPLKVLGVGPSVVAEEDITGVAAVLSQWFPRLEYIYYLTHIDSHQFDTMSYDGVPLDPEVEERQWRWDSVAQITGAFALAREQEQKWPYLAGIDEALGTWVMVEHSDAFVQE